MPYTPISIDEQLLHNFIKIGWGELGLSASDLPLLLHVELLEKLIDDPRYCVQRVEEYLQEQERIAAAPAARQEAAEAFKLARRRVGARAGSIGSAAPAWQRARGGLAMPNVIRTRRGIAPRRFARMLERPQVRGQIQ